MFIIATAPPPLLTPTLAPRASIEVVTLTVTSGSSAPTSQPSPSRGGSSVPIPAIVGGAAGGVALAVLLVLIWKYWGLVIKRDERKRRKEVQDILTVRENTRRNASSGFKPQSQYRPMLALNPDRRRVKFLSRTSTAASRRKQQQRASSPVPAGGELELRRGDTEGETQAPPLATAPPLTTAPTPNEAPRQSSLGQPLPTGAPNTETPPESSNIPHSHTELPAPTPTTNMPATIPVAHTPVRRVHTHVSSPLSTADPLMPPGSSRMPWDAYETDIPGSSKGLPVPTSSQAPVSVAVPPLPAGAAPPISSLSSVHSSSWAPTSHIPLRHSVLASSDRPVIMPRAKNASWTPPTPASGSSAQHAPSSPPAPALATSASQQSRTSGESMTRREFMSALRNKPHQGGPSSSAR